MLAMPDVRGARMLGRDILNQCSSKRDVHELDAAANAEDRDTALQRCVEEIDLELITIRVDAIRRRVDVIVAVPRRDRRQALRSREGRR